MIAILVLSFLASTMSLQLSKNFKFSKYQGLGNDFILIDNTKSNQPLLTPEEGAKLCDRNFGVGADGVIFALPGQNGCDYTMRIYNSDGSEPQMCGNGIRCMAKYLFKEIEHKNDSDEVDYKIWTNAGQIVPKLKNGVITVDMGAPILKPALVPSLLPETKDGIAIDAKLEALGNTYLTTAVSMGNPHAIIFFDDLEKMNPPFADIGPVIEKHPQFPQKVNAHFVQVLTKDHVRVKTWERGAGPTLACGTGACSVVVAGVLTGRTNRRCTVSLPGGDLDIHWNEQDNKLYMTGPAELSFQGSV